MATNLVTIRSSLAGQERVFNNMQILSLHRAEHILVARYPDFSLACAIWLQKHAAVAPSPLCVPHLWVASQPWGGGLWPWGSGWTLLERHSSCSQRRSRWEDDTLRGGWGYQHAHWDRTVEEQDWRERGGSWTITFSDWFWQKLRFTHNKYEVFMQAMSIVKKSIRPTHIPQISTRQFFLNFLSFSITFSVFPQLYQFFHNFICFSSTFSVFPYHSQFFLNFLRFL